MHAILKGIAAGVAGGIAGTLAMNTYWKVVTALTGEDPRELAHKGEPHQLDDMAVVGKQHKQGEGSTAAVGRQAYEAVTGETPTKEEKAQLSQAVHWSYGMGVAALYGATRGTQDGPDVAGGLAFGAATWLLGDELAVPMLGLSEGATAFPLEQHAHRLGAHLVYGVVTSAIAQAILSQIAPRRSPFEQALYTARRTGQSLVEAARERL